MHLPARDTHTPLPKRVVSLRAGDEQSRAASWMAANRHRWSAEQSGETSTAPRVGPIPQRGIYSESARLTRLSYLRRHAGTSLESLERTGLRADRLRGNIENAIGGVEVPVGIAGPLLFTGRNVQGPCFAPFATTEGALVSSATRGAIALTRAGGVTTRVVRRTLSRVPLFVFADAEGAQLFSLWIRDHLRELQEQVRQVSRHAQLLDVQPESRGHLVAVRFSYDTGDAAGQNMTTSCTWHACQWAIRNLAFLDGVRLENFFIESGISSDKKVSFQSLVAGRGAHVEAECVLPDKVVEDVLKVTSEQLVNGFELASLFGSQIGTIGCNVNVANAIAGIFTATGQDIACVHESSVATLHLRRVPGGVSASLVLPNLVVGTVGGGTHLPQQADLLRMMGCSGAGTVSRFAEIIAGFALALDLSTLAAIVGGQFALAHEKLGRNRPVRWFTQADLTPDFFEEGLRRTLSDASLTVQRVTLDAGAGSANSIITELTAEGIDRLVGLIPAKVEIARHGQPQCLRAMVKVKPVDTEVIAMTQRLAAMCGGRLADRYAAFKHRLGIDGCHVRELGVYEQEDPRFRTHMPAVYRTYRDDRRDAFVVAMEDLSGEEMLDPSSSIDEAHRPHVEAALRGIASMHAVWYGDEASLRRQAWLGPVVTAADLVEMRDVWLDLAQHAAAEFPEWFLRSDLDVRRRLVETMPNWCPALESGPRTLIHNDFNPRNLAFRREPGGLRLAAFDWELATLGLPQHDLAELLCYVLPADVSGDEVDAWVDLHRTELVRATGHAIAPDVWRAGFRVSLFDLALNRFGLTMAAHTFRHYAFMERVHATVRRLLDLQELP